jgi:hypothetical protein
MRAFIAITVDAMRRAIATINNALLFAIRTLRFGRTDSREGL